MRLVDSHCHINFAELSDRGDAVLQDAHRAGVGHLLCVSVALETFPAVRDLAQRHSRVFASVGVHPNETEGIDPSVEQLVALADDPLIVAIGETGLDYFRSRGDLRWQHARFRRHIEAARQVEKPLIIHTRDAADDTVAIMRDTGAAEIGGVMHCFTGDWAMAKQCLDLGFYISFSGIITFKSAAALREVAGKVPLDRLLVETDSPYLAPVPHRGRVNEPAYVRHVADCLSRLRGIDEERLADATTDNFFTLFAAAKRAVSDPIPDPICQ